MILHELFTPVNAYELMSSAARRAMLNPNTLAESQNLSENELDIIARQHIDSLKTSLLSMLGKRVTLAYYQFALASPLEQVFVEKEGENILGAAVLSLSPDDLMARFKKSFMLTIAWAAFLGILQGREKCKAVLNQFSKNSAPKVDTHEMPEVVQIFSAANARGKGVGSKLLTSAESFLKSQNINQYFVKTVTGEDNEAIRFYEKRGFIKFGERSSEGKNYSYFKKEIV